MSRNAPPITASLAPWRAAAWSRIAAQPAQAPRFEEIGRVHSVADGIAQVTGLASVRLNELLHFPEGRMGYAASLEVDHIACVLLDEPARRSLGEVPVGLDDAETPVVAEVVDRRTPSPPAVADPVVIRRIVEPTVALVEVEAVAGAAGVTAAGRAVA